MKKVDLKATFSNWWVTLKSPELFPVEIKLGIFILIPILAYSQDFGQVFSLALSDQEAQYVLLVPFVVAYFFYRRRTAFLVEKKNNKLQDLTGASLCLFALLVYILGSYSFYSLQLHLTSLPIFVAGVALLLFGPQALRSLIFPICLLVFMSPFPLFFMDAYGGGLMSSDGAIAALILSPFLPIQITYQPIVILSTVTTAGETIQFSLNAACSGIYSLTAFLFCAVVFGYLASGSVVKKVLYGVLAVVAAYLLNVFRIIATVILGHFYGIGLAVEFFHAVGGTVLAFVGTLLLLYFGSKVLKLSFMDKKAGECSSCLGAKSMGQQVCWKCGRVLQWFKSKINWKYLAVIVLFLVVCADLMVQASAVNYASATSASAINFNPNTGELGAFVNSTGWNAAFTGREKQAESVLGLIFVGDYFLTRADNSGDTISAIFEVSDLQSKFHTWEGCLQYQSYPINIKKITYVPVYDENSTIINGEVIVAEAPTLNQTLIIVYWFDTLNLATDGNVSNCNIKVTLVKYIYTSSDPQVQAQNVEAATSQLMSLSSNYEAAWSQYKNTNYSFAVDLYRNKDAFTVAVAAILAFSLAMSFWQYFLGKRFVSPQETEGKGVPKPPSEAA